MTARKWHSVLMALALAPALLACSSGDSPVGADTDQPVGTEDGASEGPAPDDAAGADGGTTEPGFDGPGRNARRLTVDQLAASVLVVTGGIGWVQNFGEGPVDMFDALRSTLGAPDYLTVTSENLEPNLVLAKFLEDGAQQICLAWTAAEQERAPAERTLIAHSDPTSVADEDVLTTLRALQLRLYGRVVSAEEDAELSGLLELFQQASGAKGASPNATAGWLAVCIAMLTDPGFVLY
jgi:hypothetical protein